MLWYFLEALRWGTSNEYPQHMFLCRNKKNVSSFLFEKKNTKKNKNKNTLPGAMAVVFI